MAGYLESETINKGERMSSFVNSMEKVDPYRENAEIFNQTLEIEELRKEVVKRLDWIENNDNCGFWWEDKSLMNLFLTLYQSGCISLPKNPVERFRWIARLCLEMSNLEEFDCGNIILPLDFLPESRLVIFEELYDPAVMESVLNLRRRLEIEGWDSVFPG